MSPTHLTRAVHLLLAAVIAIAFVGFLVGIRQGKTVAVVPPPPPREEVVTPPNAIPATAWRDFDRRLYGSNRNWQSVLTSLTQPPANQQAWSSASKSDRRALQSIRAVRRAFAGAPPVVPHPIDQMSSSSCLSCHGEGLFIGKGVRAPKMSHASLQNCTQCHVESRLLDLEAATVAKNEFEQMETPLGGARAWPGAPPMIPHTTWMRDNCLSCHGSTGPLAIRTSHPQRASCLQCHAPSAVMDQVVAQDQSPWLRL